MPDMTLNRTIVKNDMPMANALTQMTITRPVRTDASAVLPRSTPVDAGESYGFSTMNTSFSLRGKVHYVSFMSQNDQPHAQGYDQHDCYLLLRTLSMYTLHKHVVQHSLADHLDEDQHRTFCCRRRGIGL